MVVDLLKNELNLRLSRSVQFANLKAANVLLFLNNPYKRVTNVRKPLKGRSK